MHAIRIDESKRISLEELSTRPPKSLDKNDANKELALLEEELGELQELMWGARTHAVLVVLQGRDTAGKDGTIKRVAGALNPRGVQVASFGVPTEEELPARLSLEDPSGTRRGRASSPSSTAPTTRTCSSVRVHKLVKESRWRARYGHIVDFETMLFREACIVLKFFLHISKEEQRAAPDRSGGGSVEGVEAQPGRLEGAPLLGRVHQGLRGRVCVHGDRMRAVAHRPGRLEVVPEPRCRPGHRRTPCARTSRRGSKSSPREASSAAPRCGPWPSERRHEERQLFRFCMLMNSLSTYQNISATDENS